MLNIPFCWFSCYKNTGSNLYIYLLIPSFVIDTLHNTILNLGNGAKDCFNDQL